MDLHPGSQFWLQDCGNLLILPCSVPSECPPLGEGGSEGVCVCKAPRGRLEKLGGWKAVMEMMEI